MIHFTNILGVSHVLKLISGQNCALLITVVIAGHNLITVVN